MEPLTEHRLVSGPVVYGFLRLVRVSEARQEALIASLAEYCRSHELELSGVFTEREASAGPGSAAFTGLLDVLALPDVYGVLAPAASHLGPKAIAAERGRRIKTDRQLGGGVAGLGTHICRVVVNQQRSALPQSSALQLHAPSPAPSPTPQLPVGLRDRADRCSAATSFPCPGSSVVRAYE
ncbi:hypothetical protein [Streptomyces atratus]|uniref:hypothetical protein n=1 Tax=Streptomyces atratus TaxID=1893 RepID=UPI0032472897